MALLLAQMILSVHIAAALYVIAGLVVMPATVYLGWSFPGLFWFRLTHALVFGTVVVQKWFGKVCFLSTWEQHFLDIARHGSYAVPLVHSIGDRAIHVPLPLSFVTITYSVLWFYTLFLWYTASAIRPAAARSQR